MTEYLLLLPVPTVQALSQGIHLLVPHCLRVQHKTLLMHILTHHKLLYALLLQHLTEGSWQEHATFCIGLCFYVAKESHFVHLFGFLPLFYISTAKIQIFSPLSPTLLHFFTKKRVFNYI
jgi:hypothetical protein